MLKMHFLKKCILLMTQVGGFQNKISSLVCKPWNFQILFLEIFQLQTIKQKLMIWVLQRKWYLFSKCCNFFWVRQILLIKSQKIKFHVINHLKIPTLLVVKLPVYCTFSPRIHLCSEQNLEVMKLVVNAFLLTLYTPY